MHPTLGEEGPHTLPDLVGAFEELMRGPKDFFLQQVGFEMATLAHSEWIEVRRLRFAVRTCEHGLDHAVQSDSIRHLANLQSTVTLFHSVLPPKLAVCASPLGMYQLCFTTFLAWIRERDVRW